MRGNTKYYRDFEDDKHFFKGKKTPTWTMNRNSECFYCFLFIVSYISYMQVFIEYKISVRSSKQGETNSNLYMICSEHLLNGFMIISN